MKVQNGIKGFKANRKGKKMKKISVIPKSCRPMKKILQKASIVFWNAEKYKLPRPPVPFSATP